MKSTSRLIIFIIIALTAGAYAQAQQSPTPAVIRPMTVEESGDEKMARGRYESALSDYGMGVFSSDANSSDTQAYPERLVGKIVAIIAKMPKPPAIPEKAEFHARKGAAFIKLAKSPADFAKSVMEFRSAIGLAPWVFDYYFNLAVAYKLAGQFKAALNSLNLAKLLAPSEKDRRDVNGLRAEIEAAQEMAAK